MGLVRVLELTCGIPYVKYDEILLLTKSKELYTCKSGSNNNQNILCDSGSILRNSRGCLQFIYFIMSPSLQGNSPHCLK